jgi:hypothetical protein
MNHYLGKKLKMLLNGNKCVKEEWAGHTSGLPCVKKRILVGHVGSICLFFVLAAVTVLLLQVEKSIFCWCMLEAYIYLFNCPASCCYCTDCAGRKIEF